MLCFSVWSGFNVLCTDRSIFECLGKTAGMFNLSIEYNVKKFTISIKSTESKLLKFQNNLGIFYL